MTDETDTSADHMTVIAQRMRGFTELRQYADDVDTLVDERDTLAARLAEVERDLDEACNDAQDKETSADYWHEESRLQYERAEAAEAKLAVAREALNTLEDLIEEDCDCFRCAAYRHALDQLDAAQPAPLDGVTVGQADIRNAASKALFGYMDRGDRYACGVQAGVARMSAALRALTEGGE